MRRTSRRREGQRITRARTGPHPVSVPRDRTRVQMSMPLVRRDKAASRSNAHPGTLPSQMPRSSPTRRMSFTRPAILPLCNPMHIAPLRIPLPPLSLSRLPSHLLSPTSSSPVDISIKWQYPRSKRKQHNPTRPRVRLSTIVRLSHDYFWGGIVF